MFLNVNFRITTCTQITNHTILFCLFEIIDIQLENFETIRTGFKYVCTNIVGTPLLCN